MASGWALHAQRTQLSAPLERVVAGRVHDQRVSPDRSFLVYAADPLASGVVHLVRASLLGPAPVLDLGVEIRQEQSGINGPTFELDPTGARVVFLDRSDPEARELHSVPSDASAPAVRLNAPLVAQGGVSSFRITPDGRRVVYLADQELDGRFELFTVAIEGGPVVKVNGPFSGGAGVLDFQLGPDSRSVFFRANPTTATAIDLFRGSVNGRQPVVRLSPAHPAGRDVRDFQLTPDGRQVVYRADSRTNGIHELFLVPVLGRVPRVLNQTIRGPGVDGFELTPDGKRVVYSAPIQPGSALELFSVRLQGDEAPRRLDPELPGVSQVREFHVDALGRRVAFFLHRQAPALPELQSAPVDGSAPAQRLDLDDQPSLALQPGLQLSPDGARIVYRKGPVHLYGSPLDGATAPILLAKLGTSEAFAGFDPSGRRVVYGLTSVRLDGQGDPLFLGGTEIDPAGDFESQVEGSDVLTRVTVEVAPFYSRTDLYRVPIDASAAPTLVHPPFPPGPAVDDVPWFVPARQTNRAAYVTDNGHVFGVGLDGSLSAVQVSDPQWGRADGHHVVSPDGSLVAYHQSGRLSVAPLDGSQAPRLVASPALPASMTPDGARLLYLLDEGTEYFLESVPVDGSAPAVRLGGPLDRAGVVATTPDSARVLFDMGGSLFSARVDGSAAAVDLGVTRWGGPPIQLSPDGRYAVTSGITSSDPTPALRSVEVDGSAPPVELLDLSQGHLGAFAIDPSSQQVIYLLRQDDVQSLSRVALAGGAPVPLLAPFTVEVGLDFLALTGDGQQVLLPFAIKVIGFQSLAAIFEFDVLAVPVDGSQVTQTLNQHRAGPGTTFTDRHGVQHLTLPLFVGPGHAVFHEGPELVAAALGGSDARAVLASGVAEPLRAVRFTPDGGLAVFVLPLAGGSALFEAATDGSQPLRLLSGLPAPSGNVVAPCGRFCGPDFVLTPDGAFAAYLGDLDEDEVYELFASPLGSAPRRTGVPGETRRR